MRMPSHKYLIDKFIDWELVKFRLSKYPNINSHYDMQLFQECSTRPPYYCHYLSWRLGTWKNENIFAFIDKLFGIASSLPNWESERNLLLSQEFGVFWSLMWQMQIAAYFNRIDKVRVEWFETKSGPDLKVRYKNTDLFIECYNFSKSFVVDNFIRDIFSQLSEKIKIKHQLFLNFSLPNSGQDLELFLDDIFRPYLEESFLKLKMKEAENEYPVVLPVPEKADNYYIYIEGNNPSKYTAGTLPLGEGNPTAYLNQMVKESLNNKLNSNKLKDNHPNLLAINFLIGHDLQNVIMPRGGIANCQLTRPWFGLPPAPARFPQPHMVVVDNISINTIIKKPAALTASNNILHF